MDHRLFMNMYINIWVTYRLQTTDWDADTCEVCWQRRNQTFHICFVADIPKVQFAKSEQRSPSLQVKRQFPVLQIKISLFQATFSCLHINKTMGKTVFFRYDPWGESAMSTVT